MSHYLRRNKRKSREKCNCLMKNGEINLKFEGILQQGGERNRKNPTKKRI